MFVIFIPALSKNVTKNDQHSPKMIPNVSLSVLIYPFDTQNLILFQFKFWGFKNFKFVKHLSKMIFLSFLAKWVDFTKFQNFCYSE